MFRSRRSFAWSLILALLCALLVTAQKPPVAQAATQTFVVNTALDPVPTDGVCDPIGTGNGCTLRDAIVLTNAAPAADSVQIKFAIPQGAPGYLLEILPGGVQVETWTIFPTAALQFLDHDNTTFDGFSQAQFIGFDPNIFGPEIIIDGSNVTGTGGLTIRSSNNLIKGLGIINFNSNGALVGTGIEIRTRSGNLATNNTIQGCYIGVNRLGNAPAPNSYAGIWVRTDNNVIGGDNSLNNEYNVIAGNAQDGILIEGTGNRIAGNYIGLNPANTIALGNGGAGVAVRIADNNIIGATASDTNATRRNIISGNKQHGVYIYNGSGNQVGGNFIGVDRIGTKALPNLVDGVRIETSGGTAANNKIGGTTAQTRNTISGNGATGVRLRGFGTHDNQILNNLIGPSNVGAALISQATNPYTQTGVLIESRAYANTIGGTNAGEGNVISGNKGNGVTINGVQADNNRIAGNIIGMTESRLSNFANSGNGITISANDPPELEGPKGTIVGGTGSAANTISANGGSGIAIVGALVTKVGSVTITGNLIGLRKDFASGNMILAAGNGGDGIFIDKADKVRIGGSAAEANTITSNSGNGIVTSGTISTTIQNNLIGTVKSGTANLDRGNLGNGIRATGTVTVTGNSVLYNDLNGIWATDGFKSLFNTNTVNFNSQNGYLIDGGASEVQITNSTIYTNTANGVLVQGGGANPQKVKIFDNSISGNAKGIELTPDAPHPGGSSTNPNHDIDPPYALHIDQTGKLTGKIRLTPVSPAVSACEQPCTIQVFTTNPTTRDGQGRDKLNKSVLIVPDATDPSIGNFIASLGNVPVQLALTATDKTGNTSEFAVFDRVFGLDIEPPRFSSAYPGDVITYTHRVTNTGTVDFTNIKFTAFSKLGWSYQLAPTGDISLAAGTSKPLTLTLTLPTGSDPRVRAGLVEQTRLTVSATTTQPSVVTTDSVTDTTTVLGKFILDATAKQGLQGSGPPNTVIDYPRTLTNTGNVTGTVSLSAITDLGWTTIVTPTSVQLPPGKSVGVVTSVKIPQASSGTVAKTTLTLNGTPDAQHLLITDTTTVLLTPKATMVFAQELDAGAGETVQFCHQVTNLSNGPATFTLTGVSSLGSNITFISDTPGKPLVNGKTFTVGTTVGDNIFSFCAKVTVDVRALKGQTDQVSIGLLDDQGAVVGGASVRDIIHVVRNAIAPRIYMPLMTKL